MTNSNARTFLILDDQPEDQKLFGESVADQLSQSSGTEWNCVCLSPKIDIEELKGQLKSGQCGCALIDRFDADKNHIRDILTNLLKEEQKLEPQIPAWVMSGHDLATGQLEDALERWQNDLGDYFSFQGLLSKPIRTSEMLSLIQSLDTDKANGASSLEAMTWPFKNNPLPTRLLNSQNQPIWANTAWHWGQNVPETGPKTGPENQQKEFMVLSNRKNIAEKDTGKKSGDLDTYTLESWGIQTPDKQTARVQVAHIQNQYGDWLARTEHSVAVEKQLDALWQTVERLGFSRMFFFKIRSTPGGKGYAELQSLHGKAKESLNFSEKAMAHIQKLPSEDGSLPETYRISLNHQLGKMLKIFDSPSRPTDFLYELIPNSKEFKNAAAKALIDFLRLKEVKCWLKIPVIYRLDKNSDCKARGFLILDRWGEQNTAITKTEVLNRQYSLLGHCSALGDLLENAHNVYLHEKRKKASEFHQKAVSKAMKKPRDKVIRHFAKNLAKQALDFSEARICVIAWHNPFSAAATIKAAVSAKNTGRITRRDRNIFIQSVGEQVQKHSAPSLAHVLKKKKSYHCQEYNNLKKGYLKYPRIALPMRIGEGTVGAVALIDDRSDHFTLRKIRAVETLFEICTPVFNALAFEDAQFMREYAVMHEIGRFSLMALKSLDRYLPESKLKDMEASQQTELGMALWSLGLLRDAAVSFKFRMSPDKKDTDTTHAPSESVGDLLIYAEIVARAKNKRLNLNGLALQELKIRGDKAIYRFAVRSLIDNAIVHGTDKTPIEVDFSVEKRDKKQTNFLVLKVYNSGQMREEAYDKRFTVSGVVSETDRDGSHTAAATLYQIAKAYEAEFTLENIKDNKVEASLAWPIVETPLEKENKK